MSISKLGYVGEVINADDLVIAEVLSDDVGGYIAGTPMSFVPTASIAEATATNVTTSYYSGQAFWVYVSEGVSTLTLITPYLNAETEAYITGKPFDSTNGVMLDTGSPESRYFALGFRTPMSEGQDMYVWWHKGSFSIASQNRGQTETDTKTPQQLTMTYSAITTVAKIDLPNGKKNGLKKIQGDITNPNFVSAGFFDKVQFPASTTPTTKHAISVKANNSANGSVSVNPTGNQEKNTILTLSATANSGFTFSKWKSDAGGTFANANNTNTTFTMPNNAVNLTAEFI